MKVLLIEPNIEGRVGEPPLNIAILKSYINSRTRHQAMVIDLTFQKKNWKHYLSSHLQEVKYDLIGISTLSFNYSQALEVSRFLKSKFDVKIIFGGPHAILMPDEVIDNEEVDFVCTGEGEYVLEELLDHNLAGEGIQGLWYKSNREINKNEKRPLIENLDTLPFPDWSDYDLKKYFKVNVNHMSIMASRGCPYSCTYCSSHAMRKAMKGKWVRFRSVDNLMAEIESRIDQYYHLGLRHFQFNDDTFILNRDFVLDFCEKYKQKGFHRKILWAANVRANHVTDEIISAMKSAGCYEVGMGVESADDYIRNVVYKRNMSMQQILNAVDIIKKHKLQMHIPIIIGAPYDTVETMENNLQFAKKIDAECMLFPILMPLPGTEIRKMCIEENLIEEREFKGAHIMHTQPVIKTKFATREQVMKFVKKVRYYLIKKYFFDGLRRKGIIFLWDLLAFILYYKPMLKLEIDNAWKFTINKYNMERFRLERHVAA